MASTDDTGAGGPGPDPVHFERHHHIVIEAPARMVLDYVSNPQTWPEWMPATHEIRSADRPLRLGETFDERWRTRTGEVALAWRVTARTDPTLWVAETETSFTGPIIACYEITELGPGRCRYLRRIVNPTRPKPPTDEMVARIDAEAEVCLDAIKANVEHRRAGSDDPDGLHVDGEADRPRSSAGFPNPPELRSRFVDPDTIDWAPSDFPGIDTKVLWSDPGTGRSTILFRLAPGAVVPAHEHVDVEQTWVLSGSFGDHEGMAGPGQYIWRPAGNRHEASSPDGAVILAMFAAPNRFDEGARFYTE